MSESDTIKQVADLFITEAPAKEDPIQFWLKHLEKKRQAKIARRKEVIEKSKKKRITEFDDETDWVLTMVLMAMMHANPDLKPNEAIEEGRQLARKMGMPGSKAMWRKQMNRIERIGMRAEASKIRRELFKLI